MNPKVALEALVNRRISGLYQEIEPRCLSRRARSHFTDRAIPVPVNNLGAWEISTQKHSKVKTHFVMFIWCNVSNTVGNVSVLGRSCITFSFLSFLRTYWCWIPISTLLSGAHRNKLNGLTRLLIVLLGFLSRIPFYDYHITSIGSFYAVFFFNERRWGLYEYIKFYEKQEFLNSDIFQFQLPCRNRSLDSSISNQLG